MGAVALQARIPLEDRLMKYGLSELLVSAHGSLSPQLALMRLCEFIARRNLDVDLVIWARKPPAER